MLRRLLDNSFRALRRRPASWLALLGQMAALFGIPLPALSASPKDLASPFPCQHRRCGCMRAADCWNHCCCFSAQERLAWAREHGAAVPDELVDSAQCERESGTCCHTTGKKTPVTQASPEDKPTGGFVLGFMARHCQGQHDLWGCGEPGPASTSFVTWTFEWHPAGWCQTPVWTAPFVDLTPPEPPPRG